MISLISEIEKTKPITELTDREHIGGCKSEGEG